MDNMEVASDARPCFGVNALALAKGAVGFYFTTSAQLGRQRLPNRGVGLSDASWIATLNVTACGPCFVNILSTIASMLTIPIRELQQRGAKAIAKGAKGPMLVTGRPGALFYLIPADPSRLAEQEIELSRAMARADLRSWQTRAVAAGLDRTTDTEIEAEIAAVRKERRSRRKTRRPGNA